MQIIPPAHLFIVAGIQTGPQTVPAADRSLPSSAGMGLEIDLIRIQKYAFDLTFVRQMQPHDNMRERMEWFCCRWQNNGQYNCTVMQGVRGY